MERKIAEKLVEKSELARQELQMKKFIKETYLSVDKNESQQEKINKMLELFESSNKVFDKELNELK